MRQFLIALQFLSVFPIRVKPPTEQELSRAVVYFPFVGLFLGLILATVNMLLALTFLDRLLRYVILVSLLIVLTGGLHLDGLADTFDALLSRKDRTAMLEIMRDARIGTMGVLSLICVILFKISFLHSLPEKLISPSLILMCLLARYSLVLALFFFSYARSQGKARVFIEGMNLKRFFWMSIITLLCTLFILKWKGLIIFIIVLLFAFWAGKFIIKKVGGMTGDTLGAINELTEVFVLLNILILNKLHL